MVENAIDVHRELFAHPGGRHECHARRFEFVADNSGMTLLHCHRQLHMDFGLMALFQYA